MTWSLFRIRYYKHNTRKGWCPRIGEGKRSMGTLAITGYVIHNMYGCLKMDSQKVSQKPQFWDKFDRYPLWTAITRTPEVQLTWNIYLWQVHFQALVIGPKVYFHVQSDKFSKWSHKMAIVYSQIRTNYPQVPDESQVNAKRKPGV